MPENLNSWHTLKIENAISNFFKSVLLDFQPFFAIPAQPFLSTSIVVAENFTLAVKPTKANSRVSQVEEVSPNFELS